MPAPVRQNFCLCGTIFTPRRTKDGAPIAFGYLLTEKWAVLCDDTGTARSAVQHLQKGNPQRELGVGGFFCEFLEWLIAKDLHHLWKIIWIGWRSGSSPGRWINLTPP